MKNFEVNLPDMGFGDTFAKAISATKINKLMGVKKGCSKCNKRREFLNKLFPYGQKNENSSS